MQQKQKLGANNDRKEHKEAKGRDDIDNSSGSDQDKDNNLAEAMNFNDSAYLNTAPRDHREGLRGWPSSGLSSPSPITAKYLSGYIPGIGMAEADSGVPTMDSFQSEGYPASLSREEQATDASYTMLLASHRNPGTTASINGRIQEPHMNDVLCGRGGSINSHPGNRVFRGWIAQRKESYNLAESKADKTRITAEILRIVRDQNPPGRFLQKIVEGAQKSSDPYTLSGWWTEVDDIKALAKISQALREGAPAFRAQHGKKGKKNQKRPIHRAAGTRSKHKKKVEHELLPRETRKNPPRTEIEARVKHEVATPMPPLPMETDSHELDVLFPTTNNIFASSAPNGNLLGSYPLVHMGDYTASLEEVAGAIPPTPAAAKKQSVSLQPDSKSSGKCTPPNNFGPALGTPFVSPYGEAKAAWDALSFLPNLSPAAAAKSPMAKKPSLQRVHSLSFSDTDLHSIGSFNDPFVDDNHGSHKQERPQDPEGEVAGKSEGPIQSDLHASSIPPPMSVPTGRGLSKGSSGNTPGGNSVVRGHSVRKNKSTSRRDSSLSSKSVGSISNFNTCKRKSIS